LLDPAWIPLLAASDHLLRIKGDYPFPFFVENPLRLRLPIKEFFPKNLFSPSGTLRSPRFFGAMKRLFKGFANKARIGDTT
jgi:hypothetical protein